MSLLLAFVTSELLLSPNKLAQLSNFYPNLEEAAMDNFEAARSLKWASKWKVLSSKNLEQRLEDLDKLLIANNIKFITFEDSSYPPNLTHLPDYPLVIYYQGNLDLLKLAPSVTVVGSRNIHSYSSAILNNILTPLAPNLNIISGLAFGVDAAAHNIAINSNSSTIAVIGSGIDDKSFYPAANLGLKNQIINKNGLVLSEYLPGFKATIFSFPRRNRLLAALSPLTWVVQASIKSGSLITAKVALDLGKTVATTPASIFESNYFGNIELLQNGANIIASSEDLLGLLNLNSMQLSSSLPSATKLIFTSPEQELIYETLLEGALTVEQLQALTSLNLPIISSNLTLLEISSLVTNIGNNQWIKT